MTLTYEAWRITYQSSEQAARAAFERMMQLEQGKCLLQIAEPAAQSEGEAFQALSELTNALRERHYGRMPAEVQAAYDKAWTIVFTGEKSAPAAPQAVQPAVHVAHRHKFTDGHRTLKQDVFSAIHDYSATKPEQDHDDSESWESWFEAAFDLLGTRVGQIFEEHAERDAAAPAHPAEGVPAMAAPFAEVLTDEDMEDFVSTHGFTGDFESMARIVEEKVLEKVAATQPAAQGLDAQHVEAVLLEHSGCGHNTQVDQLTVRLNPGDKVVLRKGRITQGYEKANAALAAQAKQGGAA